MTKKEETVLNAVRGIVERRRAAGKFPECVTAREIVNELIDAVSRVEALHILQQLTEQQIIIQRPTINDQLYYLNNQ